MGDELRSIFEGHLVQIEYWRDERMRFGTILGFATDDNGQLIKRTVECFEDGTRRYFDTKTYRVAIKAIKLNGQSSGYSALAS
jgi:hypothetical protein